MSIKILSYFLAAIFLLSGGAKLAGLPFEINAFERWGYPLWFMYLTGTAEVIGGLALIFNWLKKYAALALTALMFGAIGTHVLHNEWPMFFIALLILIMQAILTRLLWKQSKK